MFGVTSYFFKALLMSGDERSDIVYLIEQIQRQIFFSDFRMSTEQEMEGGFVYIQLYILRFCLKR